MPKKVFLILGFFLFFCLVYSFIEPRLIEEKHFLIKSSEIPLEFSGKKIVFLADIHHGLFFSQSRFEKLIEKTNALKPDIVLLGGDYADGDSYYFKQATSLLGKLKGSIIQPIGVLGNHDYPSEEDLSVLFKNSGVKILNNENLTIGSGQDGQKFIIAGIDDLKTGWPNINNALKGTKDEDYIILISHNPDVSEEIEAQKADLILSGHTHGGQITFFGLWAPITMSNYGQKYVSGLRETVSVKTITSNGIGMVALPMRFFARPQIIVIELEKTNRKEISLGNKKINAEIAETEEERQKGLMNRQELCPNCGMLFIFNEENKHSFWMKNTLLPLNMIFIDKNKKVVDIKKAEPCWEDPCQTYTPQEPCSYVLEVPAETFTNELIGQNAIFD